MAGNTGTTTASYSVFSITSNPPSGSGSSSTAEVPVTNNQMFSQILPSTPTIVSGFATDSGVKQIQLNVNSEADNVQVVIDRYNSLPSAISTPKDNTYKYLHVTTQNLISKLQNATMTIQVANSWIASSGITQNDIALFRYNENSTQWNQLPTTFINQDSNYSYYNIVLANFSYFAIASTKTSSAVGNNTTSTGATNTTVPSGTTGMSYWTWIIAGVIILGIIIWIVISLSKKKK
jgi:PGF-pre-PGF domain-containing protein